MSRYDDYDDYDEDDDYDDFDDDPPRRRRRRPEPRERPQRSRRQSSSTGKTLLVIGAVCGTVLLLCGGGGVAIVIFGTRVLADEIQTELSKNALFNQHVGEVQSFSLNWTGTSDEPEDDVYVYDVVGSNGSGQVTVKSVTMEDDSENIEWARLKLDSGQTIDLYPQHRVPGMPPGFPGGFPGGGPRGRRF